MKAIFLAGDLRHKYAAEYLNNKSIETYFYTDFDLNEEIKTKISHSEIIALPIPMSNDNINLQTSSNNLIKIIDIINLSNEKSVIFAGKISQSVRNILKEANRKYIDYLDSESFQINNAYLSAEGALHYAKKYLSHSIYNSKIAVLGFGRIGKILSYLLLSHGARITICARKESDFTWSKLFGFNVCEIQTQNKISNLFINNEKFDIIFNTIPYWIMDENFAKNVAQDTLIIDLASYPYGIDDIIVNKYRLNYYRELSIPGRYAPKSAGELIAKVILNNIE